MMRPVARAGQSGAGMCRVCRLAASQTSRAQSRSFATNFRPRDPTQATRKSLSNGRRIWPQRHMATTPEQHSTSSRGQEGLDDILRAVEQVEGLLLTKEGLQTEQQVLLSLVACGNAADMVNGIKEEASHHDSAASNLLSLNEMRKTPAKPTSPGHQAFLSRQEAAIAKIDETAYSIVAHPSVFITPKVLKQYVDLQARLGKPETLPHVLYLYATKPIPRGSPGAATGADSEPVPQNPNKVANAVAPDVANAALDVALEARNLDAAVGIVEGTFGAKAFKRAKLLRKGMVPAAAILGVGPTAAYILATNLSQFQNTMDAGTATAVAFAGLLTYAGFTASIGLVAATTANDHMKRVTWLEGVPLRERWLREEERAALDRVAIAFGFKEPYRWGEEEAPEFKALREYALSKRMIVDRVDAMEGLSG